MKPELDEILPFSATLVTTLWRFTRPRPVRIGLVLVGLAIMISGLLRDDSVEPLELEAIGPLDRMSFQSHWENRLPQFLEVFMQASAEHQVDWTLLTAIGYQESKWQQDAVSPTGVRGLMMLTRATAKELGVIDRTDPNQSIIGAAQYLHYLISKAPQELSEPDKRWFAVSAYFGGIGRIKSAFKRWAKAQHESPSWQAFESAQLDRKDGHRTRAAVLYTRRVRDYHRLAQTLVD